MTVAAPARDLAAEWQALDEELTHACEASFRVFLRESWATFDPSPFQPNWHIDAVSDHLQAVTRGHIQNLIVNMPPRNSKTSIVSVAWPAWEWGPAGRPQRRALFTSYGSGPALSAAVKSRRLILSRWYQHRWGTRFKFASDQNVKSRFENDRGGARFSSSFESGVTGEGGDLIAVDDPTQLDDDENIEKLEHVIDEWDGTIATRINNERANRVIIMQRLNQRDLSGYVLDQAKRLHQEWTLLRLPEEFEVDTRTRVFIRGKLFFEDPRKVEGELLHPERFGRETIADLKTVSGSYRYAGRFQQRPAPRAGGIFQREWWRYWTVLPGRFDEWSQSWDATFDKVGVDPSYVCGQVWAKLGAFRYLIDQVRGRMTFTETCNAIEAMTAKWPQARLKLIERKANGAAILDALKGKISGMVPIEVTEDKVTRAKAVSPDVESHNVYLPHPSERPWTGDFVEETALFPRAAHNDQVDAMTQMLRRWHPGADSARVGVIRVPR